MNNKHLIEEERMSTNNLKAYEKITKKRTKIRWISVLVYFTIVTIVSFLPLIIEINEVTYSIVLLLIIFGGGAIMGYALFYPYFHKLKKPKKEEEIIQKDGRKVYFGEGSIFSEKITFKVIYYLTIPFFGFFTGLSVYSIIKENHSQGLVYGISGLFFLIVVALFRKLKIEANSEEILIRMGPLKTKIMIPNIKSIDLTAIRPIKDYMGLGKRLGPDGAIGYIVYLKTGVRIELEDGEVYVVTMRKGQELIDFVRVYKQKNDT